MSEVLPVNQKTVDAARSCLLMAVRSFALKSAAAMVLAYLVPTLNWAIFIGVAVGAVLGFLKRRELLKHYAQRRKETRRQIFVGGAMGVSALVILVALCTSPLLLLSMFVSRDLETYLVKVFCAINVESLTGAVILVVPSLRKNSQL